MKKWRYRRVVNWRAGGRRFRKYFESPAEAAAFARKLRDELEHAAPADGPLTAEERRAVLLARREGVDLTAAVTAAAETARRRDAACTIEELARQRMEAARQHHASARYLLELKNLLAAVVAEWGPLSAADITPEHCRLWIFRRGGGQATATLRKRRVVLSALFEHAVRNGWIPVNPVRAVKAPRMRREELDRPVAIFTPEEARRWLLAVRAEAPHLLAAEAIKLFAGLRPEETRRLDWREVRLERGHIEVTAGKSKTLKRRLVDIQPCLRAILEPLARAEGPLVAVDPRNALDRARKTAGWRGSRFIHTDLWEATRDAPPWPQDAPRHSFVSYHLAHFGDVALTELQAGHNAAVMMRHYRALVSREDAAAFWSITLPEGSAESEPPPPAT